jgi:putative peptidoglycan lipid II flippase
MKVGKTALWMLIITVVTLSLGFLRETITAAILGANWKTDSFLFSLMLPSLLFSSISGVISTSLVPIYTKIKLEASKEEANNFVNDLTNIILLFVVVIILLGEIFTGTFVSIFAPGFNEEAFDLTIILVRIMLPYMFFLALSAPFIGVLISYKKTIIPAGIVIPLHLSVIIGLLFFYKNVGLEMVSLFILVSGIVQVIILIPGLKEVGFKYKFTMNFKNKHLKSSVKLIVPMLIATLAVQFNLVFERFLASTLTEGSITYLNLANKINIASYSSFVFLIIMITFPIIAEHAASKNYEKFNKTFHKSVALILVTMFPITVLMVFFRQEIVLLLFGYGEFKLKDVANTSILLAFYSIGILFLALRDIFNRAFYSFNNTRVPMYNSIIVMISNVFLNIVLVRYMGAKGIAFASSISMILSFVILLYSFKKHFKTFSISAFSGNFLKLFIASFIMYLCLAYLNNFIYDTNVGKFVLLIKIIITSLISGCVYIGVLMIIKVNDIEFKGLIKKKLR